MFEKNVKLIEIGCLLYLVVLLVGFVIWGSVAARIEGIAGGFLIQVLAHRCVVVMSKAIVLTIGLQEMLVKI